MDYFESILKTLLEHEGYWVRQSFKVNLSKEEKRQIGKHSMPRPEIDLLAFKPEDDCIIAFEAKSFLNSPGVRINDLNHSYDIPEGRYKLFTCENYREIVFARLKNDLQSLGLCRLQTKIILGLAAGNVYQDKSEDILKLFELKGWIFWSPAYIKKRVLSLAHTKYENDASIITAKILMR